jgi:hypothetical protein
LGVGLGFVALPRIGLRFGSTLAIAAFALRS